MMENYSIASYIRNRIAMSNGMAILKVDDQDIPVRIDSLDFENRAGSVPIFSINCDVVFEKFVGAGAFKTSHDTKKLEKNGRIPHLGIKDVIFNDPATIVFWNDGTKTVVKCQNDEQFDAEKGLAMAIIKKKLGNKGNYFNEIKKWTEKYNLKEEERQTVNVILEYLYNCLTKPSTETKDDTNA